MREDKRERGECAGYKIVRFSKSLQTTWDIFVLREEREDNEREEREDNERREREDNEREEREDNERREREDNERRERRQ